METLIIPQPDTLQVSWGWFQFLLLLTFPLHLLAMNAMVGGLVIGVAQHLTGGERGRLLAHKIALALPLVIAFTVNFGVAPLLFVQVLYGQFIYSSSVLMGSFWILIIPMLIIAYYGAYLYDFKFTRLGMSGPLIGLLSLSLILVIGFFFSNNMLLMSVPEEFQRYFSQMNGTLLVAERAELWPRFLHMILGACAVGALFVAMLCRFSGDKELSVYGTGLGVKMFLYLTGLNVLVGFWYLLSLPDGLTSLFMGGSTIASALLIVGLLLAAGAVWAAVKGKYWLTLSHAVMLVVVMSLMRSALRSGYLHDVFTLDQLEVIPQYSPMIFFFATLVLGLICLYWLIRKTLDCVAEGN